MIVVDLGGERVEGALERVEAAHNAGSAAARAGRSKRLYVRVKNKAMRKR